jgi:glutamate/aspartate transport system substrate-binding protein
VIRRWLVAAGCALAAAGALAQENAGGSLELSGTLARAHAAGAVTIAYREASVPFSFVIAHGNPQGYSIDLCRAIVDAMSEEVGATLAVKWLRVTSESRLPAITSGQADLECGSTTANPERATEVDFSRSTSRRSSSSPAPS